VNFSKAGILIQYSNNQAAGENRCVGSGTGGTYLATEIAAAVARGAIHAARSATQRTARCSRRCS